MSQLEVHEFEPVMICSNCDELHEDCNCDDTCLEETDECEYCSMTESEGNHEK